MATLGTRLFTWLHGQYVGKDELGNKYYRSRKIRRGRFEIGRPGTERRWVIYKGVAEPSLVPPYWHGWLHHVTDEAPDEDTVKRFYAWQKPHKPNLTGTDFAYRPPGHLLQGAQREKATGDYEAWKPE